MILRYSSVVGTVLYEFLGDEGVSIDKVTEERRRRKRRIFAFAQAIPSYVSENDKGGVIPPVYERLSAVMTDAEEILLEKSLRQAVQSQRGNKVVSEICKHFKAEERRSNYARKREPTRRETLEDEMRDREQLIQNICDRL